MRRYVIAAVTLVCVGALMGQQNVVPNEAVKRQMERALIASAKPTAAFTVKPGGQIVFQSPTTCAIPLLEAKVKPTNDHLAPKNTNRTLDKGMAKKPAIPACPGK